MGNWALTIDPRYAEQYGVIVERLLALGGEAAGVLERVTRGELVAENRKEQTRAWLQVRTAELVLRIVKYHVMKMGPVASEAGEEDPLAAVIGELQGRSPPAGELEAEG